MNSDTKKILQFTYEIDKLKGVIRKIDLNHKLKKEDSAQHSWHTAMMVWVFAKDYEEKLDLEKAIKMALIHDLVEIYAGDVWFYDHKARVNKYQNEKKAAQKLFKFLPTKLRLEMMNLWLEFEERNTPESKLVQAMDKIQPILQNILTNGKTWKNLKVTTDMVVDHKINFMKESPFLLKFFKYLLQEIKVRKITY